MRGWQQGIANRTDAMAVIQTELIRRDTTWRLTRAEATKANAPPDVTELVDNILQRNRVLQDTVEARIVEDGQAAVPDHSHDRPAATGG